MSFAFSPLGAVYLAMLFVPNLLWARGRRPEVDPGPKENPVLLVLERIGQAATTLAALVVPRSESPGTRVSRSSSIGKS